MTVAMVRGLFTYTTDTSGSPCVTVAMVRVPFTYTTNTSGYPQRPYIIETMHSYTLPM